MRDPNTQQWIRLHNSAECSTQYLQTLPPGPIMHTLQYLVVNNVQGVYLKHLVLDYKLIGARRHTNVFLHFVKVN